MIHNFFVIWEISKKVWGVWKHVSKVYLGGVARTAPILLSNLFLGIRAPIPSEFIPNLIRSCRNAAQSSQATPRFLHLIKYKFKTIFPCIVSHATPMTYSNAAKLISLDTCMCVCYSLNMTSKTIILQRNVNGKTHATKLTRAVHMHVDIIDVLVVRCIARGVVVDVDELIDNVTDRY